MNEEITFLPETPTELELLDAVKQLQRIVNTQQATIQLLENRITTLEAS